MPSTSTAPTRIDRAQWDATLAAARGGWLTDQHGQTYVFTGKLSVPRDQLEELVRTLHGRASGTVAPGCTLVTNETRNTVKYRAANQMGVLIVSEQEFIAQLVPARGIRPPAGWVDHA